MNTQTPILAKTNQHYQLTVPLPIRKKNPIAKGSWFIVKLVEKGILFQPADLSEQNTDYADPLDDDEIKSIKQSLKEIKEGKFTIITSAAELKKHFK